MSRLPNPVDYLTNPVRNVGDVVWYLFDTGTFGLQMLYGVVIAAGQKTYTVRWQSGIRNRIRNENSSVKLLTDPELLVEARRALRI